MVSVDVKHHVYLHIFFADNRLSETCSISEAVPKGSKDPTALLQSDRHQNLDSRTSLPAVVRFRQLDTRCWQNWFQYDYLHPSCWFCYIFMSFSPPPEKHLFVSYISEFSYFGHLWFDGWPSVCQCSYSCECQSLVTHGMCSHGITFLLLCQSMVLLCRAAYNMCVCVRMCACAGAWPSQCLYDSVLCQCVWERERDWLRERRFRPTKPANS